MKMNRIVCGLFLGLMLMQSAWADVVFRSGRIANIADLAIRVKTPFQAEDRPIPTLSSYEYKGVTLYAPFEWWSNQALSGIWSNPYSMLFVAEMNRMPPQKEARPVPEAGCKVAAPIPEKWTPEQEVQWVEAFAGCKVRQREVEPKKLVDRILTRFDIEAAKEEKAVGFLIVSNHKIYSLVFQ